MKKLLISLAFTFAVTIAPASNVSESNVNFLPSSLVSNTLTTNLLKSDTTQRNVFACRQSCRNDYFACKKTKQGETFGFCVQEYVDCAELCIFPGGGF